MENSAPSPAPPATMPQIKYDLRSLTMRNQLTIFTCFTVFSLAIAGCTSQPSPPPQKKGLKTDVTTESAPESTEKKEDTRKLPDFPRSPTKLTLYSIDFRDEDRSGGVKNDGKERLVNYLVLGKVEVRDTAKREAIMAAIRKALHEPAEPLKCFDPRHGLKIVDEKGVTEMVICFECFQFISTGAHPSQPWETISATPQELLTSILKEAGIEVLPGMEELMKQRREQQEFEKQLR